MSFDGSPQAEALSLREIHYLLKLAETRHFGRAAEQLYVAQPGLSRAIKELERKLGVALFVRSSREVTLTEAGRSLLEEAEAISLLAARLIDKAQAFRQGEAGSLAIGFVPMAEDTAEEILETFSVAHPAINLNHRREYIKPLRAAVVAGSLDAAIVIPDRAANDDLIGVRLFDLPLFAAVGREHPLAAREVISPIDLEGYPIPYLGSPGGDILMQSVEPALAQFGITPTWVKIHDSVSRFPVHTSNVRNYVWLQTDQLRRSPETVLLTLEPALRIPFDVVTRAHNPNPSLAKFLRHALTKVEGSSESVSRP